MRQIFTILCPLLLWAALTTQALAHEAKCHIAVMPISTLNVDSRQAAYVNCFYQNLVEYLTQTDRFDVINANFAAEKQPEAASSACANAPAAESLCMAGTLDIDYMVVGQLNATESPPYETKSAHMRNMRYALTLKVIEPATGMIVSSKIYSEEAGFKLHENNNLKPAEANVAAIDSLAATAARKAGMDILNEIFPIMAIAYNPEGIFTINQGRDTVKVGQKYRVYLYDDTQTDMDVAAEPGPNEKTIGMVEITEVMPKFAFAKVLELACMQDIYTLVSNNNVILRPAAEQTPVKTPPPPTKSQPKW